MIKLKWFFVAILLTMLAISTWASVEENVGVGLQHLIQYRWGVATLFDTYACFFTIYLWIAYKETTMLKRVLWLVLGICLGTMASSLYLLIQLIKLPRGAGAHQLLLRSPSTHG